MPDKKVSDLCISALAQSIDRPVCELVARQALEWPTIDARMVALRLTWERTLAAGDALTRCAPIRIGWG